MSHKALDAWHAFVRSKNSVEFKKALADTVRFHSPVVHTPQVGKTITLLYLETAHDVLANGTFRYERELVGEYDAVPATGLHICWNSTYDGSPTHEVWIYQWNYDTTSWTRLTANDTDFPSDEVSPEKRALKNWSQVGRAMLGQHSDDE